MKKLLFFSFILVFCHCKKQTSNSLNKEVMLNVNKKDIGGNFLQKNDSLSIIFWNSYNAVEYHISYINDGIIYVKNKNKSSIKRVTSELKIKEFIKYIDSLYIRKLNPINSKKEKTIIPVSDYSKIIVVGFKNDKILFKREDILFSKDYFSESFLDFQKFLIQICKE
ncbi:MAG: hypothetical protein GKR88_14870 [Flavobacteriaceae bacterium]|nr:MAG: hypothetical protein GKR88_14870 [Flavobacteriaceae bacterium]